MSKCLSSRRLLITILAFGIFGNTVTPVSASPVSSVKPHIKTILTINNLNNVALGDAFIITGSIKDTDYKPIADKSILFTLEDEYLGQARSDIYGNFERKINAKLKAGNYVITATSKKSTLLELATSSMDLKVMPATVRVQTVPAIAGVSFKMNGKTYISGIDGFINLSFDEIGEYRLHVLTEAYNNPSQRIKFGRWLDESFEPYRDIRIPGNKEIQVGLNVEQLVSQSFVDMDGNQVDQGRVSEFSIRSTQGDAFEFSDGQPHWLPASRTARRVNGLEETKLLYSVIEVIVDGSNVVNKSQQRFYTQPGANWEISLLFNSIRVRAQDAFLGSAVGKSVNLEFPDGSVKNYHLNQNGMAEIHSLPRGNYYVEFLGTNGLSNRTPVALSRYQDVHIKVITYLDLIIVGTSGFALALGLLLYGRPELLHLFLRKKTSVVQ